MKRIIYAKCDTMFKQNGCIHLWSADYPDINREVYTFADNINSLSCRMSIYSAAKEIEDRVREKSNEPLFEIHIEER